MAKVQFTLILFSVGSPPEVIEPLLDTTKTAPEDIVLECTINPGDPKAEITWFRKDRQVGSFILINTVALCDVTFGDKI